MGRLGNILTTLSIVSILILLNSIDGRSEKLSCLETTENPDLEIGYYCGDRNNKLIVLNKTSAKKEIRVKSPTPFSTKQKSLIVDPKSKQHFDIDSNDFDIQVEF